MAGTKPDGGLRRTAAPARRGGFTIEEIFGLTKIDRWFLVQIKEIVDFEEKLATAKN
jgi:Carbamoyl-phosphate synthetase large chain, oligomerisation domain